MKSLEGEDDASQIHRTEKHVTNISITCRFRAVFLVRHWKIFVAVSFNMRDVLWIIKGMYLEPRELT